jgi:mono/diheme cytochrome c family protein
MRCSGASTSFTPAPATAATPTIRTTAHSGPAAGAWTPEFGTFYVPNLTPDVATGIGAWSAADFRRAMIEGETPDGSHYYPVFPYRWYTGMSERDLADLWAYLRSVPPVYNRVRPHDLRFPFNPRFLLLGWKLINFDQGERVYDPQHSDAWNRGAYLVNHLGHCGACYTPKMLMGAAFQEDKLLAGSEVIPGPYPAPNITPHDVTGIGKWTTDDVVRALKRSIRPDGLPIRGPMAEYVDSGRAICPSMTSRRRRSTCCRCRRSRVRCQSTCSCDARGGSMFTTAVVLGLDPRTPTRWRHCAMSSYRSRQPGLVLSIRAISHARSHRFRVFSRWIATVMSL